MYTMKQLATRMVDLYFPMIARMSEHAAGLHAERWAHGIQSIFKILEHPRGPSTSR